MQLSPRTLSLACFPRCWPGRAPPVRCALEQAAGGLGWPAGGLPFDVKFRGSCGRSLEVLYKLILFIVYSDVYFLFQ